MMTTQVRASVDSLTFFSSRVPPDTRLDAREFLSYPCVRYEVKSQLPHIIRVTPLPLNATPS